MRRKSVVVSVRMFREDMEEIRKMALYERTQKSTLMRRIVTDYIRKENEK